MWCECPPWPHLWHCFSPWHLCYCSRNNSYSNNCYHLINKAIIIIIVVLVVVMMCPWNLMNVRKMVLGNLIAIQHILQQHQLIKWIIPIKVQFSINKTHHYVATLHRFLRHGMHYNHVMKIFSQLKSDTLSCKPCEPYYVTKSTVIHSHVHCKQSNLTS